MDLLFTAALIAAGLLLSFVLGAIFGATVYMKGRERSSPISLLTRAKTESNNAPVSPAERDAEFERNLRKSNHVKA